MPAHGTLARTFAVVLAAAVLGTGCLHTARIVTEPEGANVTINGQFKGPSPILFQDRSGTPRTYYVKIEKPGYKTLDLTIESVYKADIKLLLLIPGIIPYFFTAELEDSYPFTLQQ